MRIVCRLVAIRALWDAFEEFVDFSRVNAWESARRERGQKVSMGMCTWPGIPCPLFLECRWWVFAARWVWTG